MSVTPIAIMYACKQEYIKEEEGECRTAYMPRATTLSTVHDLYNDIHLWWSPTHADSRVGRVCAIASARALARIGWAPRAPGAVLCNVCMPR